MKKKTNLRAINWSVFILVVLIAVITAVFTFYDLYHTPAFGEAAQSRVGLRWGTPHIIILSVILIISVSLAIGWKRLFLFNVPIAIILVGFCYVLLFLTCTIGWVGIQCILGFFISFFIGMILIISYLISFLIQRRRVQKNFDKGVNP